MCSATYSVLLFSHAEDLDPEEGEGDVDSQLSGQQGGETFFFFFSSTCLWFNPNSSHILELLQGAEKGELTILEIPSFALLSNLWEDSAAAAEEELLLAGQLN